MRLIFKYPLPIRDCVEIEMPEGAEILSVQNQNGVPTIWAAVENAPMVRRRFFIAGTGHPLPPGKFIGTCVGSQFVWHIFEA